MSNYDLDTALVGDVVDDLLSGYSRVGEADLLEGYGDQIVGAARQRRPVPAKSLNRMVLGLGATSLLTLTSAVITVTPQIPFRLERLISPSTGLQVTDLKVGTNSQFVGSGSIPIEIFARDSVGIQLKGDTAVPGVDIALALSNPTGGTLIATGAYVGAAASG